MYISFMRRNSDRRRSFSSFNCAASAKSSASAVWALKAPPGDWSSPFIRLITGTGSRITHLATGVHDAIGFWDALANEPSFNFDFNRARLCLRTFGELQSQKPVIELGLDSVRVDR